MRARLELILWAVALASAALAAREWRGSQERAADASGAPRVVTAHATGRAATSGADGIDAVVAVDPFRPQRHPSPVSFRPDSDAVAQRPPASPNPTLVLAGIVGGPPWEALLEGLPGRDGAVLVRRGDTFGALRIGGISRDTAFVFGADTVWRLGLKRTWQ